MKQALDAMRSCIDQGREECRQETGALHAALADVEAAQARLKTECRRR
jgi:hypothetical protein